MTIDPRIEELGDLLLARLKESGQGLSEIQFRLRVGVPVGNLLREAGGTFKIDPEAEADLESFLRGLPVGSR